MVRNLMLIFGLSLALASFGCSDSNDDNGGGGGGGEGGVGGAGGVGGGGGSVTPTDACVNTADLAMVCMPDFGDTYVGPCATTASGDGAATSACLQEDPPALSTDCADCFGAQVQCIRDNCVLGASNVCFPPIADQEACDACADDAGCTAPAESCIGDLATACAG